MRSLRQSDNHFINLIKVNELRQVLRMTNNRHARNVLMVIAVHCSDHAVTKFRIELYLADNRRGNFATTYHDCAVTGQTRNTCIDSDLAVKLTTDDHADHAEKPDIKDHLARIVSQNIGAFEDNCD